MRRGSPPDSAYSINRELAGALAPDIDDLLAVMGPERTSLCRVIVRELPGLAGQSSVLEIRPGKGRNL